MSNPGPLAVELDALPTAVRGPAIFQAESCAVVNGDASAVFTKRNNLDGLLFVPVDG